jgi:hypothetical protein
MKKLLFVLPVLAGLFFAGCDTSTDYSPLAVGNIWNYSGYTTMASTQASTDTTMMLTQTIKVIGTDTLNNGTSVFVIEATITEDMSLPDTTFTIVDTSYYAETDSSVVAYGDKSATEGQIVLRIPLEAGASWMQGSSTMTVAEQEDVTVTAGTYKSAWRLDITNPAYPDMQSHGWYANKVGQVKTEMTYTQSGYTVHQLLELTSATIK